MRTFKQYLINVGIRSKDFNNNEGETLFIGYIKNYNELKTLMKQVGII